MKRAGGKKKTKAQLAREARCANAKAWSELSASMRAERGACEKCGETENLCVHYVLEKRLWPELLLEERDLVVLCRSCHLKAHGHQAAEFHAWLTDAKPCQWKWIKKTALSKVNHK